MASSQEELNEASYSRWMCECVRTECTEMVEMTLGEYEELHAAPNRFAVMADSSHVDPAVEEMVRRNQRYWAVEKTGEAAIVARQLDERVA